MCYATDRSFSEGAFKTKYYLFALEHMISRTIWIEAISKQQLSIDIVLDSWLLLRG